MTPGAVRRRGWVNATGLRFDFVMALELHPERLTNPMVNTGALATTSLVPGRTAAEKWTAIATVWPSAASGQRRAVSAERSPAEAAQVAATRP